MDYSSYGAGNQSIGQNNPVSPLNGLRPDQPQILRPAQSLFLLQDEPRGASQLIEVLIPAVGTARQLLPVIQNLQSQTNVDVILKAFRLIPPTVLTNAPTLTGVNAPLTELVKMSLVLYSEEWEKGTLIPLCTLIDTFTEGSGVPWRTKTTRFDDWRNVNWGKSYIQFSNGLAAVGAPYVVIFEAEYQKFNKAGKEIQGAV
jgi:hypothetical protein